MGFDILPCHHLRETKVWPFRMEYQILIQLKRFINFKNCSSDAFKQKLKYLGNSILSVTVCDWINQLWRKSNRRLGQKMPENYFG